MAKRETIDTQLERVRVALHRLALPDEIDNFTADRGFAEPFRNVVRSVS
jgi:hypothetical protein